MYNHNLFLKIHIFSFSANNIIKFERTDFMEENFNSGNLENVLNALAGLYILERYLFKNIATNSSNSHEPDIPNPPSKIFNLNLLSSNAINLCNALGIVEVGWFNQSTL